MAARKTQTNRLINYDLFGHPIEEPEPSRNSIVPLDFEGESGERKQIRMVFLRGMAHWVGVDLCRAIGAGNSRQALARLDDDEKGVHIVDTPGGPQEMVVVNQSGLYHLLLTTRKKDGEEHPTVARFRRWVTHEVLPEIQRTGTYVPRGGRVAHEARRLGVDLETAKARCDQFATNKEVHRELAETGACPNDFAEFNNVIYLHEFGDTAPGMRAKLGIKGWQTPLDFMEDLPLQSNRHIKLLVAERIRSLGGSEVPRSVRLKIAAEIASEMAAFDAQRLGPSARIDLKDDPNRGKVIGVVRNALATV